MSRTVCERSESSRFRNGSGVSFACGASTSNRSARFSGISSPSITPSRVGTQCEPSAER